MNLRIDLVHGWQRAYRWFSIQAAVALVVVSAVRETAQQLVDGVPALEWVAHAHWYPPTMIVLGSLAALLRLVHQPAVAAAAPPATIDPDAETTAASARIAAGLAPIAAHVPTAVPTAVPTDPAALLQAAILNLGIDTTMSPIFRNILARIPQLVIDTEAAFKGTPGSGADKAATVTSIVAAALPADASDGMAKAQAIMQMAVAFFNATHPLFQKPGASTITAAFPAPTA